MPDWTIKGLSIRTIYQPDWDKIGNIFEKYGVYLRGYTPALTIHELKNIEIADQLTQELKHNENLRKWAINGLGFVVDEKELEAEIEKKIFEKLLWLIPEFNRQYATEILKEFLTNGHADNDLRNLFMINGIVRHAKREIELVVESMIKKIKK
jgi:hypothetical protein